MAPLCAADRVNRELRSSVVGAAVDAYDRHVGRYGPELARELIRVAGIQPSHRVLDVGCGTGALTHALAEVVGAERVAGIDPSERFVAACRERVPGADLRIGVAEELPWGEDEFDSVLAQLVVDGMNDTRRGVSEMCRVARPQGVLAACVWDFARGMTLLRAVWDAALDVDTDLARSFGAEARARYSHPDQLEELWKAIGLEDIELGQIEAGAEYADLDDLWYPFANGVGSLGRYHDALDEAGRDRFKRAAEERLGSPRGPFRLAATAWYVRGTVP
jgi:ubiquinone/menaquinone biosynthesis C-methylase UbiE